MKVMDIMTYYDCDCPGEPWHRVYCSNEEPYAPLEECSVCGLRWLATQAAHADPDFKHLGAGELLGSKMKKHDETYSPGKISDPSVKLLEYNIV